MDTRFDPDAVERLCEELISQYADMERCVKRFDNVLDRYSGELEDNIMRISKKILDDIKDNMNRINKYIFEFTESKQDAARDIGMLEKSFQKEVGNLG